jgi:hypothetical protein
MIVSSMMILLVGAIQPEPRKLPDSVQVEPVRKLLAALVEAAAENQGRPAGPRKGDELTDFLIRRAIQASLEEKTTPQELCVALGIGLDTTDVLRNHEVAGPILALFETDVQRQRRLKVLGRPTMKGRHDWVMHFALSAALTGALDAEMAEQVGIFKEILDSKGGSGFSFADLAADYAGINFAQSLLKDSKGAPAKLTRWSKEFRANAWLPRMDEFEEGLTSEQVRARFGAPDDPRFLRACQIVRAKVAATMQP